MELPLIGQIRKWFGRRPEAAPARTGLLVSPEQIEALTGCRANNLELYERALRHRSVLRGLTESSIESNERLEFLGDAVLSLVVSEYLYRRFSDENEGFLTRVRAQLVNGPVLSRFAASINLGDHIILSANTAASGGRENESILADAFEALIGAIYLDLGFEQASRFIHSNVLRAVDIEALVESRENYKSMLLEFAQARGWSQPVYRIVSEEGPGHDREFEVEVLIDDRVHGRGEAKSKKKAEQNAASVALQELHRSEGEAVRDPAEDIPAGPPD